MKSKQGDVTLAILTGIAVTVIVVTNMLGFNKPIADDSKFYRGMEDFERHDHAMKNYNIKWYSQMTEAKQKAFDKGSLVGFTNENER